MISVCMATHNGEKYIKEQIDSILVQLSDNDELVISDDGSIDRTCDIICEYNEPRIRLVKYVHPKVYNDKFASFRYATNNFVNAILHAKGDYIFLSDQDDVWHSNKIQIMLPHLQNDNLCVMHRVSVIYESNELTIKRGRHYSYFTSMIYLPFKGSCMAFSRELISNLFPVPHKYITHDMWIGAWSLFVENKFLIIDDALIDYRVHSSNVSVGTQNNFTFKVYYRIILFYNILKRAFILRHIKKNSK